MCGACKWMHTTACVCCVCEHTYMIVCNKHNPHHWIEPSCKLLQVLQNAPKDNIGVVCIEEHAEDGLSSTGIGNHLGWIARAVERYHDMQF